MMVEGWSWESRFVLLNSILRREPARATCQ